MSYVRNSTAAVAAGRYKNVNTPGASGAMNLLARTQDIARPLLFSKLSPSA